MSFGIILKRLTDDRGSRVPSQIAEQMQMTCIGRLLRERVRR